MSGEVDACDLDSAVGGGDETGQHPHGGGFTGTVGAKEGHYLSAIDGEGNVRDRGEVSEMLGQAFSLDHDLGHGMLHCLSIR